MNIKFRTQVHVHTLEMGSWLFVNFTLQKIILVFRYSFIILFALYQHFKYYVLIALQLL
jgi:hypothetical protein